MVRTREPGDLLAHVERVLNSRDPIPADYLVTVSPGQEFIPGSVAKPLHGGQFVLLESGLFAPASAGRGADPIDQMYAFLEPEEVFGFACSFEVVIRQLTAVPREDVVAWCASWLARFSAPNRDRDDINRDFATMYFGSELLQRTLNLLAGDRHRTLLVPQALTMLMKLAFEVCAPRVPDEIVAHAEERMRTNALVLAAVGMNQHLDLHLSDIEATAAGNGPQELTTEMRSRLYSEVVANQIFNSRRDEISTWAMFQRCWRELPAELLAAQRGMVDLAAEYEAATGVPLDDLVAVCSALWASSSNGTPVVALSYLANMRLSAERLDCVLRLIAADANQMRQMLADETEEFGPSWSIRTFREFPVLRTGDFLVCLDPHLLIDRATGLWPLYDIRRDLHHDRKRVDAVEKAVTLVHEEYVIEAVSDLVGEASGRLYREDDLRRAFGRAGKVADVAVDYGHTWVVLEATTMGLNSKTIAGRENGSMDRDIADYVRKAKQLEVTVANLRRDERRLTGRPPFVGPRRFRPLLVVTNRFATGVVMTALLRSRLAELDILQGDDVAPLEVLEIQDLDAVSGYLEAHGAGLLTLLAGHEQSGMTNASIRDWIIVELGQRASNPARVEQRWERWFDAAKEALREVS